MKMMPSCRVTLTPWTVTEEPASVLDCLHRGLIRHFRAVIICLGTDVGETRGKLITLETETRKGRCLRSLIYTIPNFVSMHVCWGRSTAHVSPSVVQTAAVGAHSPWRQNGDTCTIGRGATPVQSECHRELLHDLSSNLIRLGWEWCNPLFVSLKCYRIVNFGSSPT